MLGKIYADKARVQGVNQNPKNNEVIYQQYLKAFKKGVYNYIKEDADKYTNQIISRKNFAGGMRNSWAQVANTVRSDRATIAKDIGDATQLDVVSTMIDSKGDFLDPAMTGLITAFRNKLRERHATIRDIESVRTVPVSQQQIRDLEWHLFEMGKDRYLELFTRADEIVAYGIVTVMHGNAILGFQSFAKSSGKGEYWASIYRERVLQLNTALIRLKKPITHVAVPMDQILSEDQLAKRTRAYFKFIRRNGGSEQQALNVIDAARLGQPLSEIGRKIINFKLFPEHYSFGPAANLYVNKLGFSLIPIVHAPHRATISPEDQVLMRRLKDGEQPSDLEIFTLFSGRALIKPIADFDRAMNGGIDLNAANLDMTIKRDGKGVPLPFVQQDMAQLSRIKGFVPRILEIRPAATLPILNELKNKQQPHDF